MVSLLFQIVIIGIDSIDGVALFHILACIVQPSAGADPENSRASYIDTVNILLSIL